MDGGGTRPADYPPPIDTQGELIKRELDADRRSDRGGCGDRRRRHRGARMREPVAAICSPTIPTRSSVLAKCLFA